MTHPYHALDDFARGYVEAMFFTNGDNDEGVFLDALGVERLTKASVAAIKRDCDAFTGRIMPDRCFARQWIDRLAMVHPSYGDGVCDDRRAGHMFWYARQGHGVAWTEDYASGTAAYEYADALQNASRAFGECYVEVSRGWIHVR